MRLPGWLQARAKTGRWNLILLFARHNSNLSTDRDIAGKRSGLEVLNGVSDLINNLPFHVKLVRPIDFANLRSILFPMLSKYTSVVLE